MSLATISGGGAFTKKNITDINNNFAAVTEPDLWVRPQYGTNASADGSYSKPFATVGAALSSQRCVPGIVIGLLGVTTEEVTGPIINDITIVGMANRPRQATTSGTPNGGGATWLSSAGTAACLQIRGQGWTVQNIYFNQSGSAVPCIDILTAGDPPTAADGAHVRLVDCVFTGADDGVTITGGTNFVNIEGCVFFNFTGSGDTAIKAVAGLGIGTNMGYRFIGNQFYNNVNHIVVPCNLGYFSGNSIMVEGTTVATTTTAISFSGGTTNVVMGNFLGDALTGAAATWTGGTNDKWCNFTSDDGVGSGVPS